MKNKGFTLIELVGTIVIISLILLIVTPAISNSLKKGVSNADKQMEESIIMAAKNYFSDNKNRSCVKLSTLQEEGYADINIKKPSDGEIITNVKVVKNGNKYELKDGEC